MLTGRRFRIDTPTLAVKEGPGGKRVAVTIPAGAIVKVISGPTDGDRIVDVLWEGQAIEMFTIDLQRRGVELSEGSAG